MARESKKIVYKIAHGADTEWTLQRGLKSALAKFRRANDRLEPLGAAGSEVRFINFTRQHKGVTCGVFHKVTRGAAQHVIDMQKTGEEWKVIPVKATTETRPNGEFVEG